MLRKNKIIQVLFIFFEKIKIHLKKPSWHILCSFILINFNSYINEKYKSYKKEYLCDFFWFTF